MLVLSLSETIDQSAIAHGMSWYDYFLMRDYGHVF